MKKLILTAVLSIFLLNNSFSQTVNDKPIKDIDVEYIQIVGTAKFMSNKVNVKIDFGQASTYFSAKGNQIKDAAGKLVAFNSMIDALNFFDGNGYQYIDAYTLTIGNQNVYHYLLKKKK